VPDAWLYDVWEAMAPFVIRACERSFGCYTPAYLAQQIADRKFQLWAGSDDTGMPRVLLITHLNQHPSGILAAQIVALAGEGILFREQALMIEEVKRWAMAQGADRLEYGGREGFLRTCPGWVKTSVNAVMELHYG
jgi:hypothetical protein